MLKKSQSSCLLPPIDAHTPAALSRKSSKSSFHRTSQDRRARLEIELNIDDFGRYATAIEDEQVEKHVTEKAVLPTEAEPTQPRARRALTLPSLTGCKAIVSQAYGTLPRMSTPIAPTEALATILSPVVPGARPVKDLSPVQTALSSSSPPIVPAYGETRHDSAIIDGIVETILIHKRLSHIDLKQATRESSRILDKAVFSP